MTFGRTAAWRAARGKGIEVFTGSRNLHPPLDPQRSNNPVGAVLTPDLDTLLVANHEAVISPSCLYLAEAC